MGVKLTPEGKEGEGEVIPLSLSLLGIVGHSLISSQRHIDRKIVFVSSLQVAVFGVN